MSDNSGTRAPATGVVPLQEIVGQPGLRFLRDMVAGRHPLPPISERIPMRMVEAEEGRVVFESQPDARFYNPIGTVHGGFAATLLDSAMACAVHTTLQAGEGYTSLEIKVSFVRAMTDETGPVRAEGVVLHRGRRIATAEGGLRDGAGRLLAHATTTCMIFDAHGGVPA